ncbi:MAG: nucleotidyltransferase family protein [Eubacterium sp.]
MNCGIICEFNPFHMGHKYLIDSIKTNGDTVICAMSGSFVQRGEFAVYDKYTRAETALRNGADLVIEIPSVCSILSAQGFAKAGVKILESTGICDSIAFGAECDDTDELKRISREIIEHDCEIKAELKKGISYPQARQNVIKSPVLDCPNNILAIEYLTYTKLKPIAVKRIGKGHDSDDKKYSASEIRKSLCASEISTMKNCESAILYKLRQMNAEDFSKIDDVSEGLENRIVDAVRTSSNLEEIYDKINTKRYTHSRIRRIILRAFLSIDKSIPKEPQYLHILGFSEKGRELLSKMKNAADLPIISKYSDINNQSSLVKQLYEQECILTDIYNLGYTTPRPCGTEQRSKVIKV